MYVFVSIYICIIKCIYFFVCSLLKHQLNNDILDKSGTCISKAISMPSRK